MDTDIISYETMLATQNAANWALGAMLAAFAGLLVSIATLFFAKQAIDTWKQQEILKVKMDFKRSLMNLKTAFYQYPDHLDAAKIIHGREFLNHSGDLTIADQSARFETMKYDQFNKVFLGCCDSWVATEHLFLKTNIEKKWNEIMNRMEMFDKGELRGNEIKIKVQELYTENFVFS